MKLEEKIEFIANHYGFEPQCRQTIEEMAELMIALNKFLRKSVDSFEVGGTVEDACLMLKEEYKNITEEIADVQIMLYQLSVFLGNRVQVSNMMKEKIDRQLERIKRE